MSHFKIGQKLTHPACECGGIIIVGEFASHCLKCGASVDPYTGKILVSGEEAKKIGAYLKQSIKESEMNYTKGEWEHNGNQIVVTGRGVIAVCPSLTTSNGVLEFQANAHLIAAAPDMYEALKALQSGWNATVHEQCMEVLAKVEGR